MNHTEQVLQSELDGWVQQMQDSLAKLRESQGPKKETTLPEEGPAPPQPTSNVQPPVDGQPPANGKPPADGEPRAAVNQLLTLHRQPTVNQLLTRPRRR